MSSTSKTDASPSSETNYVDSRLGFRAFDADNHCYEVADAYTRYLDPAIVERAKQRGLVGFDGELYPRTVPPPGGFGDAIRDSGDGTSILDFDLFGAQEEQSVLTHPEYFQRDARLKTMDAQGLEGTFLYPTLAGEIETQFLGLGDEQMLGALLGRPKDASFVRSKECDIEGAMASLAALNRWLDDDWGFAYHDRIFVPMFLSLSDVDWAIRELEWGLDRGLRLISIRQGPAYTASGPRSPADPMFDPFWARVQEAGVTTIIHFNPPDEYAELLGMFEPPVHAVNSPLSLVAWNNRALTVFMAALVCHHLFERFPKLRFASIESGADWVPALLHELGRSHRLFGTHFQTSPIDQFLEHVWVAPFFEERLEEVTTYLPTDRILFGSDWPHSEGYADPINWVEAASSFAPADVRRMMRDNAMELTKP